MIKNYRFIQILVVIIECPRAWFDPIEYILKKTKKYANIVIMYIIINMIVGWR